MTRARRGHGRASVEFGMLAARRIRLIWQACATVIALLPMCAAAGPEQSSSCGPLGPPVVTVGPYDYRTDRKEVLFIEGNHFQPQVQELVAGVSGNYIGGDLDFLLRHVPNHPKGLLTLIRYGEKLKWAPAKGLQFTYECYFDRAIRFRPEDPMVRMIYAIYLNKFSRTPEALKQLAYASDVAKDDAFTRYNIGLIYVDMKQYDLALAEAHKASSLGFSRPELRDRLKAAGKWRDPVQADQAPVEQSKP